MKEQFYERSKYGYSSYIIFLVIPPSTVRLMPVTKLFVGLDQLCLGIIASGIGFVLAQRAPFRFRDIRRRL